MTFPGSKFSTYYKNMLSDADDRVEKITNLLNYFQIVKYKWLFIHKCLYMKHVNTVHFVNY